MSRDGTHAKLAYDWYGSWTILYNLFADSLLCFHLENSTSGAINAVTPPSEFPQPMNAIEQIPLNPNQPSDNPQKPLQPPHSPYSATTSGFVPSHIYTKQSKWYSSVMQRYGLPLDNRHLYTKTDWELFSAAVAAPSTKKQIIEAIALWLNETVTDRPFSDLHQTEGRGGFPGPNFFARPAVGGHFSLVALQRACGGKAEEGLGFLYRK